MTAAMTDRPRGPAPAAARGAQRRDPDRAQAAVDQDPAAHRSGVHRADRAGAPRGAAHRLPGSRLPQHLRVLGRPRGDLPHRRRRLHPALRLLPDRHRQARSRSTATSRAGSPSRSRQMGLRYATVTGVARDDLARRGRLALRRDRPRDPRGAARLRSRAADPGLLRQSRRCSARCSPPRPRCSRTTSRPCRASSAAIRPGLSLRAFARRDHAGARRRPGHQEQPDPRHGRDPRGDQRRRCSTCTTPAASCSRSPSTCGRPRATTR